MEKYNRLQLLKECYNLETERCNKVERKAYAYIVIIGISIAILANGIVGLLHVCGNLPSYIVIIGLVSIIAIILFMVLSIYHSIKVVSRASYCYIDPEDVHSNYKDEEFEDKLCDDYKHAIKYNLKSTNAKVDEMVKAQKFMIVANMLILVSVIIVSIACAIASYIAL